MSDDDDTFIPFSEFIGPRDPGPYVRGKWHRSVAKAKAKKAEAEARKAAEEAAQQKAAEEAEAKARYDALQIDTRNIGVPGTPGPMGAPKRRRKR
ncbi:hypothetical protein [Paenirhodobacter populi]|uniref:Uncharacterized protein n=1 Tax=Paenirhodobacter populi TaxID=2306993 RepID=A0A443IJH2_9RHOB|nr:hypothetical protein [Sinirhodobacter populi]RWR04477.1 hypothetical protein D2T33_20980 [Sinirhodobacter populi]